MLSANTMHHRPKTSTIPWPYDRSAPWPQHGSPLAQVSGPPPGSRIRSWKSYPSGVATGGRWSVSRPGRAASTWWAMAWNHLLNAPSRPPFVRLACKHDSRRTRYTFNIQTIEDRVRFTMCTVPRSAPFPLPAYHWHGTSSRSSSSPPLRAVPARPVVGPFRSVVTPTESHGR